MLSNEDPKRLAQIALVALIAIGCVAVLLPFIGAVLFAFVIWICSWDFYSQKMLPRLGGRDALGAALMVVVLALTLLLPSFFLAGAVASGADRLVTFAKPYFEQGLPADPPAWLSGISIIGAEIDTFWHRVVSNREELNALLRQMATPARQFLLALGAIVANGLLQLALVLLVSYFLFRDGAAVSRALYAGARKLGGELGEGMVAKARGTVVGVMFGIVLTAVAQSAVATIGFLIAGVPGALLLGFATFFLSMIPVGPPLLWGGAAFWLYGDGQTAWAIFMALYGFFVISSIDNIVKPLLMARGTGLSILLIALGVLGGVLVFGFIGIFLGPVLLALGQMLFQRWIHS